MSDKNLFKSIKSWRGQSFVELAVSLPVILLILLGLIEVAFFLGKYMDILDLTRLAARYGSQREIYRNLPSANPALWDENCSSGLTDFFRDTACVLSPPDGTAGCDPLFCNGYNVISNLMFAPVADDPMTAVDESDNNNPGMDDIVITAFTVDGSNTVSNVWPRDNFWGATGHVTPEGSWALSGAAANYTKDCQGDDSGATPYYTEDKVNDYLATVTGALPSKGYVAVEVFYCHRQVLSLGIFTVFVPDPVRIHAYTLFSLPSAQPTAVSP